jgi:hypothetical protein
LNNEDQLEITRYISTQLYENKDKALKLRCRSRFQHLFTVCICVFKVITLVGSNQHNYFENAIACSKRTFKTTVATQLKAFIHFSTDLKGLIQMAPSKVLGI